jgi:hypothetical protein
VEIPEYAGGVPQRMPISLLGDGAHVRQSFRSGIIVWQERVGRPGRKKTIGCKTR